MFNNLDVDGDGKIDKDEIMVFATKILLDKSKKSSDNEIRKIASQMECIENFDS
jgi:Ca2+-binding EF-hand superfamily protein